MKFLWATASHPGRIRDNNEDRVFPESDGKTDDSLIIAVADGMGGHAAGEVASQIAIEEATETTGNPNAESRRATKPSSMRFSRSQAWRGWGQLSPWPKSTRSGRVTLGHVGDSRAYLLRSDELSQLTTDHSFVQEEIEAGRMDEEEARDHPKRGLITRALGLGRDIDVDVKRIRLLPDDRLLLCSDGLNSMINDDAIARILSEGSPSEAAWALIEAANQAGGHDNVSVVVVVTEP